MGIALTPDISHEQKTLVDWLLRVIVPRSLGIVTSPIVGKPFSTN